MTLRIQLAAMALFIATAVNAQTNYKTLVSDFQRISGYWKGSLTYLDYSSGKPYTMPADLAVKRLEKTNTFIFSNSYPNERSADSRDTVVISTDGKYIDKERIKSRKRLSGGEIELITEETGRDGNDNKPAIFKYTYTFGKTGFKKRKDVQFAGEKVWINRHEYTYARVSGT